MEKKSKSDILPVSEMPGRGGGQFMPVPPGTVPPGRAQRSMTCLDLTLQCVVFQDRDGSANSGNGAQGTSTSNTALLNMNQRFNQMKAQKELTSVQMYSQRMVRLRMSQNQKKILPWFGNTVVVPQGLG